MESNKASSIKKKIIGCSVFILMIAVIAMAVIVNKNSNKVNQLDKNDTEKQKQITTVTSNADQYNNILIAQNDDYELYLYGPTLSVTIKNKKTGATLESSVAEDDGKNNAQWLGFMKSGIVLEFNYKNTDQNQADLVNNNPVIWIDTIENGFQADVAFPNFGFQFQVRAVLDGDSMVVEIPDESIVEAMNDYTIGAINVFPFLGYSYLGEKAGYMFIPDGNGALINLDDKEGRLTGGYSQLIYGDDIGFKDSETVSLWAEGYQTVNDAEYILAPIFGLVHTEDQIGFLGIIEEGAGRASIEAYPNGVKVNYNRIYPKFIKRRVYVQPLSKSNTGTVKKTEQDRTRYDIKVRYCFVSDKDAHYTGLAVTYRDYLLNQSDITIKDNSYHTRLDFLGTEREDGLVFKKRVTMTTVDQIRDIYQELEEEGISDLFSVYKGWQSGGLYNIPFSTYQADSGIGGTSKLTKLIKDITDSGNQMYLYQDMLRLNQDENKTNFNIVKRVNKRAYEESVYKEVYQSFSFLMPDRTQYFINKIENKYLNKGIKDIAISGITNSIFSYSYKGKYYSRMDTLNDYDKAISGMNDHFNLVLEQPFFYLWNYTDAFLNMPVGTSNYNFIDAEIPFLSIVLKGVLPMYSEYVNFEANKQDFFLELIEKGIFPSFYITYEDSSDLIYTNSADIYSSKYSMYKNTIIEYARAMKEVNDAVQDAFITNHHRLDSGVTVVNYDNGVNIYVNYSNQDQVIDGYTVEAMSYKVGEAQ